MFLIRIVTGGAGGADCASHTFLPAQITCLSRLPISQDIAARVEGYWNYWELVSLQREKPFKQRQTQLNKDVLLNNLGSV